MPDPPPPPPPCYSYITQLPRASLLTPSLRTQLPRASLSTLDFAPSPSTPPACSSNKTTNGRGERRRVAGGHRDRHTHRCAGQEPVHPRYLRPPLHHLLLQPEAAPLPRPRQLPRRRRPHDGRARRRAPRLLPARRPHPPGRRRRALRGRGRGGRGRRGRGPGRLRRRPRRRGGRGGNAGPRAVHRRDEPRGAPPPTARRAVHQACGRPGGGLRLQPRGAGRHLHVALHVLLGRALPRRHPAVAAARPRPVAGPARPRAPGPAGVRRGPREDGPERAQEGAGGPRLLLPGGHRGPHQGRRQRRAAAGRQALLHLPVPRRAHLARRLPRPGARPRRHHRLRRLRRLPLPPRPAAPSRLLRQPHPGRVHRRSGRDAPRRSTRACRGAPAEGHRRARRGGGDPEAGGVRGGAQAVPLQRRGAQLRGRRQLAALQGLRRGLRLRPAGARAQRRQQQVRRHGLPLPGPRRRRRHRRRAGAAAGAHGKAPEGCRLPPPAGSGGLLIMNYEHHPIRRSLMARLAYYYQFVHG